MSDSTETIQFLPESRRRLEIKNPGEYKLLYLSLGWLGLCLLLYGGVWFYSGQLGQQITKQDAAITAKNEERDQAFEREALALNQRLAEVDVMLNQHPVWSLVLAKLQGITPPSVQFITLIGNIEKGSMTIKALAPDYPTIAKKIANYLASDIVKDIDMNKAILNSSGAVEYTMIISFNPDKILLVNYKPKK